MKKIMSNRLLRILSTGLVLCMVFGVMQASAFAIITQTMTGEGHNIEIFNNGSVFVTNYPYAAVGQYYDYTPQILSNLNPGYENLTYHIIPEACNNETPAYFGLSCDTSTGRVYGTPTRDGRLFVYLSYDGGIKNYNALIVTIRKAVTSPTVSDLQDGVVGEPYVVPSFSMNSGTGGDGYFICDEDTLPPGLFCNPSRTNVVLSGVPTQAGTYTVKFTAVNTPSRGDVYKEIVIREPATLQPGVPVNNSTLTFNPSAKTLYSGQIGGDAAEWEFTSTAYPAPTWTVDKSTLPANTVFSNFQYSDGRTVIKVIHNNSTTGYDEVTPGGSYTVRVTASNVVDGQTYSKSYELPLTVCLPAGYGGLSFSTNHETATVGEYKSIAMNPTYETAVFPVPTYSLSTGFNITSSLVKRGLPDGMTLDPNTATISGTPTEAGRYIIYIKATNPYLLANGSDADKVTGTWDMLALDVGEGEPTPPTPTVVKLTDSNGTDLNGSAVKVITGDKTINIKDSNETAITSGATLSYKAFNKTTGAFDTTVTPSGISFNAANGAITFGCTKSQLVKVIVSIGGAEVGSIIHIVPGNVDLVGRVTTADWMQALRWQYDKTTPELYTLPGLNIPISRVMADMNSDSITNPTITSADWMAVLRLQYAPQS